MKRIRYFDLLRVICFCIVVYCHMMIQLYIEGMFTPEAVNAYMTNANMHIGTLAVAVFFMLSGASLMLSTKDCMDYKKFYIKRFLRLLIPFYFVNVCWFIIRAVRAKSIVTLISGIAPWKIILGILGIDEWLNLYGVSTFSQGIGEWFLGCIVILYVLFPLFRKLLLKNKTLFLAAVILIYFVILCTYSSPIAVHQNIWVKGCEFIFGMYLGLYWDKADKRILIISIPVIIFFLTSKTVLPVNDGFKVTAFALAVFTTFSCTENILQKSTYFYKVIAFLSGCSYELFLVHHLVIYNITPIGRLYMHKKQDVLVLFLVELAVMGGLTLVVKFICDRFIKYISGRI